jgi:hypothetical protein
VKRAVLGLAVLAVLVVAAYGVITWRQRSSIMNGGPVSAGAGSASGQRLGVGEDFSFGNTVLVNRSKQPAQLEKIRVMGITAGFQVLGVRAIPTPVVPHQVYNYLGDFGFPPAKYPSKPLAEERVVPVAKTHTDGGEPYEGLELVIGARANRPGVAVARGVEFTYRVGGRRYRRTYEGAMYLCAPKEQYEGDACPGDALDKFGDGAAEFSVTE